MVYIIILLISVVFNISLRKVFVNLKVTDKINHRSSHTSIATRSGGIVLFSIIFIYTTYLYFDGFQPYDFSILVPMSILFATGLYDDIYNVDFGLKFIFQIIAAKLLVDMGFVIDIFSIFGVEYSFTRTLSQVLSIFSYVAIFNAYNFIDGIDLNIILETCKSIIIMMFLFNYSNDLIKLILIILIILISIIPFNINKKIKVFMGDSGSLIIPVILIFLVNQGILLNEDKNVLKYLALIFIYPIFDLIRVILIRIKTGTSPFKADKNHIHHFINKKIKNHIKSSLIIFSTSLIIQMILILIFI